MFDTNKLKEIGINHAKLKELRGTVNQSEIGGKIGVSDRQISNIEAGIRNPSAEGLLRLMLLYGIKPEDIALIK